jgi:subtilisin
MKRALTIGLMIALLSPPLLVAANEQTIPNGVQRIGAASGTYLDFSSVGVAVVDTGVDLANPDLNVVGGVDCTTPTADPFSGGHSDDLTFNVEAFETEEWDELRNPNATGYDDGHGHGTHVSGIIGAKDNGRGVVGVAPNASIWSVRVLDSGGSGSIDNIVCGLDWIHENRDLIDVVNMSLGVDVGEPVLDMIEACDPEYAAPAPVYLPQPEPKLIDPVHDAICQLHDDGIVVVVAAGNGPGDSRNVLPAAYEEVITVSNFVDTDGLPGGLGGLQDTDACPFGGMDDTFFAHRNHTPDQRLESYSGRAVDIMAPGVCVLSTVPGGYMAMTGTSMASPHVAGVVARLIADGAPPDVEAIRAILLENAEDNIGQFRDIDDSWEPLVRVP